MMQFETAGAARALRFAPEPRQKSAGRRAWTATALMVAGTLAVALTSYSISLKVSAERAEAERQSRQNVALEARLKALEAELRVRMRLPQLQRWNDEVLSLKPITSAQYLGTSVHLAAYGNELPSPFAAQPQAVPAVQPGQPAPAAVLPALRTELSPRTDTGLKLAAAVLPRASAPAPAPRAAAATAVVAPKPAAAPTIDPQLVAVIEAMADREAGEAKPTDLLHKVDMPSPPPGGN